MQRAPLAAIGMLLLASIPAAVADPGDLDLTEKAADAAKRIERRVGTSTNFLETVRAAEPDLRTLREQAAATRIPGEPDRHTSDGVLTRYERWRWYWQDRVLPDGSYPDLNAIYRDVIEQRRAASLKSGTGKSGAMVWTNINETTTAGGYVGMGRTTDIAFHPSDPDTFFVASPRGGLWKTTDGGDSYSPISDALPFVSISNVVVDPQDPDVLYAAIGDNVWYGPPSSGIYKTTDGGQNWNSTGLTFEFSNGTRVWDLVIDPAAPGTLLAATSRGVYRTTDGFATHTRVFAADTRDIAFRPGDSQTLYLASNGIQKEVYKSIDGGTSWTRKSDLDNAGEMRLAVTPADSQLLGVLTADGRFFKSTDAGETFSGGVNTGSGGQLAISAVDPDLIYGGFVNIHRSQDGGDNWSQFTIWYGGHPTLPAVHADQRNVEINPLLPDSIFWCNDGGLYRYRETAQSWQDRSSGLIITQYYKIANAQSDARIVIGGTQDNGGRIRRETLDWGPTNGGDAMEVAIDPGDPDVLYTEYINGNLYRSLDGWRADQYHSIGDNIPGAKTGDWVMPFELSPDDSHTIVAGYDRVWRSTDRGDSWTAVSDVLASGGLDHVALAPGHPAVIYAADSGYNGDNYGGGGGTIFRTMNLGGSWTATTSLPTWNRISGLDVADHDRMVVFAGVSGYTDGEKVFVSRNGGTTWSNVSGRLPNVPVNDVRYVPDSGNTVYVATDVGVYYRDDTLTDWQLYGPDLPMVSVVDIDFQYAAGLIRIGTHGRGIYEAPLEKRDRDYCVPQHIGCCYNTISQVRLDTFQKESDAPTSVGTEGFSDFTLTEFTVAAGQTVSLAVTPQQALDDAALAAWIDWNRDGTFSEGELVLSATGPGPWTGDVAVPADAVLGTTTLRVRLQSGPDVTPDPCAASGNPNGETEDYRIVIAVDSDGDTVPDETDAAPIDPTLCRDLDADGCDDCAGGVADLLADGPDTDGDGLCDLGDPDADGDGFANEEDCAPLDGSIFVLPRPVGSTLSVRFVAADTVRLQWRAGFQAQSFNVYAGTIVPGQTWAYDESCRAPEVVNGWLDLPSVQQSGTAAYYLVSARNTCGDSGIGVTADGVERFADPACPAGPP